MLQTSPKQKVGILTLPLTHNYGGILQCIALQKVMEDIECDVLVLDRQYPEIYWKRFLKKIAFWFSDAEIRRFKKKYLNNVSRPIRTSEMLKAVVLENELQTVVVGSDQVWREQYVSGFSQDYFLGCLAEIPIKKIAYAASFGTEKVSKQIDSIKALELLRKFSAISVRETSGLQILKHKFKLENASLVLDPTLLLSPSFYEEISREASVTHLEDTIAVYLLDETKEKQKQVEQLAKRKGLSICQIHHQPKRIWGRIFQQKKGVSHWLQTIKDAEFVVTDSYHGMLFSILFKKQFVVWVNEKRGAARFTSIANQLGLQHRLVKDLELIDDASWYHEKIDYDTVNAKLLLLQEQSLAFLKDNLNKFL